MLLGVVGGAFVLTWPLGAEVNPPALAGIAVAVTNLGGFVGAALTQGPVGAVLDARWTGALAEGARVYPVASYRGAFAICALFVLVGSRDQPPAQGDARARTSITGCVRPVIRGNRAP